MRYKKMLFKIWSEKEYRFIFFLSILLIIISAAYPKQIEALGNIATAVALYFAFKSVKASKNALELSVVPVLTVSAKSPDDNYQFISLSIKNISSNSSDVARNVRVSLNNKCFNGPVLLYTQGEKNIEIENPHFSEICKLGSALHVEYENIHGRKFRITIIGDGKLPNFTRLLGEKFVDITLPQQSLDVIN